MSTSWIKLRTGLYEEPEVVAMAELLGVPVEHVVGLFAKLWGWADDHLSDMIKGFTEMPGAWFDQYVHFPGFIGAAARCAPHWVVMDGDRVVLRNLDRHNGQGAKTRALEARRKRDVRNAGRSSGAPKTKPAATVVTYPDWLPLDTWVKFVDARNQMKKPMTAHAKELTIKDLEKYRAEGHDPKQLLELAIKRGWQGIYLDTGKNGAATKPEPTRYVPNDLPQWMKDEKAKEKI